jgi:hypothetical protein
MPVGGAGGVSIRGGGGMGRAPRIDSWEMRNGQSTRCSGRAALGATNPDQPASASASPTRWYGGHRRRPGRGGGQPDPREAGSVREVGHLDVDLPLPQVPGQLLVRWQPPLGQVPVPLGPCRRIVHGQIEGVHVVAALPSVVGRRIPVGEGRSAGVGMPDPTARDADRVDVERQALDGAWIFQLRDDAGDAPIVATGDDVQRLVVVERLDRFGEPYGDVVGVHHAR